MSIQHTSSDRVHVAAEPVGKVQKCQNCRTVLHDKSKWQWNDGEDMDTAFWEVGGMVLKRRSGARVLTPAQATEFPSCSEVSHVAA